MPNSGGFSIVFSFSLPLTFYLHDMAVFSTCYQGMIEVLPCIPALHLKLNCLLLDLAVVLNAGHGHASNAIKSHLQSSKMLKPLLWTVPTALKAWLRSTDIRLPYGHTWSEYIQMQFVWLQAQKTAVHAM